MVKVNILASTLVTGGAENVVHALALRLPSYGYSPSILCLRGPGETGLALEKAGVPLIARLSRGRFDPAASWRVARVLSGGKAGLLLCLDHHDAIFHGLIAARLASMRSRVLAVHSTGLWGGRRTFSFIDRLMIKGFSRIVALAASHERYLVDVEGVDGGRTFVINNGVDTGRFKPADEGSRLMARKSLGIAPDALAIVIVAALRPEKNHRMLLEAFKRSRVRGKGRADPVLVIAGDGPERNTIEAEAGKLGIQGSVYLLGRRNDVETVLHAADISVLCSHPVVETFPLSVLEAMSCGVPVISTRVGSVPEMIEDGVDGLLVDPGDADGLSAAIDLLAEESETARRISRNARQKVVERYSEERMVEAYACLFDGLLSTKGGTLE